MTSNLLGRSLGSISPQALRQAETSRLLHLLQAAPGIRFDSSDAGTSSEPKEAGKEGKENAPNAWAHRAGVNCLTIDKFEGR